MLLDFHNKLTTVATGYGKCLIDGRQLFGLIFTNIEMNIDYRSDDL
jgi:hypothetical protein